MACDSHIAWLDPAISRVATSTKVASRTLASTLMVLVGPPAGPSAPIVDLDRNGIDRILPRPFQITNIGPTSGPAGIFRRRRPSLARPILRALVPDHPRSQHVAGVPVLTGIGLCSLDPSSLSSSIRRRQLPPASATEHRDSARYPPGIRSRPGFASPDTNGNLALTNVVTPSVYYPSVSFRW